MKQELLNKYSIAVPRYTSYPPANFFNDSFTSDSYKKAVMASNAEDPQHISIYIHIPFCNRMCYYCGCNAMLLRKTDIVDSYIDAIKQEIRMILPSLDKGRKISQIHYGGGSPTSQPVAILKEINDIILSEFDCIERPEIAIECHPGYLDAAYWADLSNAGFNRISLGIQDFNEDVLKTVNRKSSLLPVEDIVTSLRAKDIAINMDFIYGLPKQTINSFMNTIDKAITLRPDRIVTFSYAHVPWVNELQLKLEEAGLPTSSLKNKLYESARERLTDAGYKTIGMDHFVLPTDELYIAQQEKTLHRNFQGYCTQRTTGQVYAFGMTGISQLSTAYSQNTKNMDEYINSINKGIIPVAKGYSLNLDEQITRSVISSLMCNYMIEWSRIAQQFNISVENVKQIINYNESTLNEFVQDGIIEFDTDKLIVVPSAAALVRNVAASFDKLMLNNNNQKYSKSV